MLAEYELFVNKFEHVLGVQGQVGVYRGTPFVDMRNDRQTDTTKNITFATLFAIGNNDVLLLSVYPVLTCRILCLSNNNYDLFSTNTGFISVCE